MFDHFMKEKRHFNVTFCFLSFAQICHFKMHIELIHEGKIFKISSAVEKSSSYQDIPLDLKI